MSNMTLKVSEFNGTYDFDVYDEESKILLASVVYSSKENKFYRIRKADKNEGLEDLETRISIESLDENQKVELEELVARIKNGDSLNESELKRVLDMFHVGSIEELEDKSKPYLDLTYTQKEIEAQELLEDLIVKQIAKSIHNNPNAKTGEAKAYAVDIIKRILAEKGIIIQTDQQNKKMDYDLDLIKRYTRGNNISSKELLDLKLGL